MSAIRRLSAVYRREQRQIRACPYHRSEESLQKEKKASRVRQPSFFSSYLPLIPSQWSSYLGYFNIFNIFGSSKDSKKKEEEDANVVVLPEEDVVMTDNETTTTTTEESSSDSSVEIIEVAELVEPVTPLESMKPMPYARSTVAAESFKSVVPATASSSEPTSSSRSHPQSSYQTVGCTIGLPPPSTEPQLFDNDDDLIKWVEGKVERREGMTDADFLTFKLFFENTRKELKHQPIKLRFSRFAPAKAPPVCKSGPNGSSNQQSLSSATSSSTSQTNDPSLPSVGPSCFSGFHSSTGLPTFKNNISRPKRMLKSSPYGPIEWRGVGSVRCAPEENVKRSASSPLPRLDPYKRRRLFERTNAPEFTKSRPPSSIVTEVEPSVSPRLPRTSINRQHTATHAPSPLRNVVNGPVSSPRHPNTMPTNLNANSSKGSRVTYSATVVREIIEKTPPRPRYSDVANPYQTAVLPTKPLSKPMEKKKMSERRARTKELERQREISKAKELEKKELSAKEIIEATIPKGAKRSRPPAGLSRPKPIGTFGPVVTSKRSLEDSDEQSVPKKRRTVTVEEISDDDNIGSRLIPVKPNVIIEPRSPSPEPAPGFVQPHADASSTENTEPPAKESLVKTTSTPTTPTTLTKDQPTNAVSAKDSPSKSVGKDVPARVVSTRDASPRTQTTKESSLKTPSTKGLFSKGPGNHIAPLLTAKMIGKSSVPREPSKLRTSFLPDDYENEEPKVASPTPATTVVMTTPGTPLADIQEKKDPKEVALTLPLNDLPSFIFKTPPTLTAGDHTDARVAAKELPVNSLPKFDFSKARSSMNGMYLPAVPIPTIKPFDFGAAGISTSASPSDGQWQCSICMLQNTSAAVEKCSICDSPRPDVEKPKNATVNGVNGVSGTHGMNSASGKDSSSRSSKSSSSVKGYNFTAAALKPNTRVTDGQWTCPTCMLQNPPTALENCKVCDSARPGADKMEKPKKAYPNGTANSPGNLTNGISATATKSFDYAAAGVKPAAFRNNGNWQCPTCMLQNPATAIEKCEICDSPRPGVEKKPVSSCPLPVKPSAPVVSKSFDWAAAGMVPKINGNSWTCGICMLSNPPSATEKCRVCDASRS